MKTVIFITLFIAGIFGIITALTRPDIFTNKYSEIRAPVDKYFADKNRTLWNNAKENERSAWILKMQLPKDCINAITALKKLECRSETNRQMQNFEIAWANKVRSGWKPEGTN